MDPARLPKIVICVILFSALGCGDDAVTPPPEDGDGGGREVAGVFMLDRFGGKLAGVWAFSAERAFLLAGENAVLDVNAGETAIMDVGAQGRLVDIWASSPSDVFAVSILPGDARGAILHYDGTGWTHMTHPLLSYMTGVFGSAPDDVYAVDGGGAVARYDGKSWTVFRPGDSRLYRGWAGGPDDVYVAGDSGVAYYDGDSWRTMSAGGYRLYDVFRVGRGEVLALGVLTGVLRVDTLGWDKSYLTSTVFLAIDGTGANDVYAVGAGGGIAHYDGSGWSPVSVPGVSANLWGVSASSPTHAVAVGDRGAVAVLNGASWTGGQSESPEVWLGLCGVGDSVVAGSMRGNVRWYDGSQWNAIAPPAGTWEIRDVWMDGFDSVWFVRNPPGDDNVLVWDGSAWEVLSGPANANAVWGFADGGVVCAVGLGEVYVYDYDDPGGAPAVHEVAAVQLEDAWGASADDLYAVGAGGTVLHYDGAGWTVVPVELSQDLYGVWGTSSRDIVVVGAGGSILHYDGARWSTQASGASQDLTAVWGDAPDDYWAAGAVSTVLHFDGRRWRPVHLDVETGLAAVWGSTAGIVFMGGTVDCLMRWVPAE